MDENVLREMVPDVTAGRLGRRAFLRAMAAAGISAPLAAQMLPAQPRSPVFTPSRRGGGGKLRLLWWQAPVLLNPHFANGIKDSDASRVVHEPLVSVDPDGNLVPVLAADVPSVEAGTLARDGRSVTWRLRKNVAWHDGRPFTAADVIFNWDSAAAGDGCVSSGGSRRCC